MLGILIYKSVGTVIVTLLALPVIFVLSLLFEKEPDPDALEAQARQKDADEKGSHD